MKILIIGLAVVGVVLSGCNPIGVEQQDKSGSGEQAAMDQSITLVFDFDGKLATYSSELAESVTALSVLEEVGEREQIDVVTQEYDFGVLVESIDGMENSSDRAWIYFVNGMAGDVGAGQKELEPGDVLEWKYIEPIY